MRIFDDGFGCLGFDLPRAIPRIVRTRENITVTFGSFLHQFDGDVSACARIKCINDGPVLVRGVSRRQVKRVTLFGVCAGDYFRMEDTSLKNVRIAAGRWALPTEDPDTKQQGR